ncbi:hypothetical protein [Streptomyces sp. KR80]|uniref:hypothetical protein n=1 Tax=Streptomyces sp. KR80 TaxID=3457426 RepID=UPI003FD5E2A3
MAFSATAFFADTFLTWAFFAGAVGTAAFLATLFFAGAFAGAFFAGARFAGAFFAALAVFATAFVDVFFFAVLAFAGGFVVAAPEDLADAVLFTAVFFATMAAAPSHMVTLHAHRAWDDKSTRSARQRGEPLGGPGDRSTEPS